MRFVILVAIKVYCQRKSKGIYFVQLIITYRWSVLIMRGEKRNTVLSPTKFLFMKTTLYESYVEEHTMWLK